MAYGKTEFDNKIAAIRALPNDSFMYDEPCIQCYQLSSLPFSEQQDDIVLQGNAMAEAILLRLDDFFSGIKKAKFNPYPKVYNQSLWGNHDGCYSRITNTVSKNVQREKNIAKALYNLSHCGRNILLDHRGLIRDLGQIMDYETPLNYESSRNIDLISTKGNRLYILELKKGHSKETLLRCLLEAYTYSRLSNRPRLKEAFGISQDDKITICPLIFDNSAAFQELHNMFKTATNERKSKLLSLALAIEKSDPEIQISFAAINSMAANNLLLNTPDADGHVLKSTCLD